MVIFQKPNMPIIVAFCALILWRLLGQSIIGNIFYTVYVIAILYWAGLEIFLGVNWFRRLLGIMVALLVIHGVVLRILQ